VSSANRVHSISSFPIWVPFTFLSCLIVLWIAVVKINTHVILLIIGRKLSVIYHWIWAELWAFINKYH
jgi:hypothetical protein